MMDLERLDEALHYHDGCKTYEAYRGHVTDSELQTVLAAARAYRNLLANGERAEPDYRAAEDVLLDLPREANPTSDEWAKAIVDAAVGGRLLVDPPKEETT